MDIFVAIFESRLLVYIPLIMSLTVHEWAHAWAALRLGDDTALRLGRVTLNPLAHLDPVGTVALPLLGAPIGWAKPVPFNPIRFRREVPMERGRLLVAAAGPISNILFGAAAFAGLVLLQHLPGGEAPMVRSLLVSLLYINLALAFFNLLPLPPLDGSHVMEVLCPRAFRPYWEPVARSGMYTLVFVIFVLPLAAGVDPIGALLSGLHQGVSSMLGSVTGVDAAAGCTPR